MKTFAQQEINRINIKLGDCHWSEKSTAWLEKKKIVHAKTWAHVCATVQGPGIWLHSEYTSPYWFQKSNRTNAWLWQRRDGNLLHLRDKGMDWLIHILVCLTKCFVWTMPTLKGGRKNPAELVWITYLNRLSKLGWFFFFSPPLSFPPGSTME